MFVLTKAEIIKSTVCTETHFCNKGNLEEKKHFNMKCRIYYHFDVAGFVLEKISVASMYSFTWTSGAKRCHCFSDLFIYSFFV